MGKAETRLTDKMRKTGAAYYGDRLVIVKYHGNEFSRAGVSDLIGCLDGAFWCCEVKAPESYGNSVDRALAEGPTVLQQAFIGHVLDAGGYGWVAAIVEQFMEGLAAVDQMNREWCAVCYYEGACIIHPLNKPAIV